MANIIEYNNQFQQNIFNIVKESKFNQFLAIKRHPQQNWQLFEQFCRWLDQTLLGREVETLITFQQNYQIDLTTTRYPSMELYKIFLSSPKS